MPVTIQRFSNVELYIATARNIIIALYTAQMPYYRIWKQKHIINIHKFYVTHSSTYFKRSTITLLPNLNEWDSYYTMKLKFKCVTRIIMLFRAMLKLS